MGDDFLKDAAHAFFDETSFLAKTYPPNTMKRVPNFLNLHQLDLHEDDELPLEQPWCLSPDKLPRHHQSHALFVSSPQKAAADLSEFSSQIQTDNLSPHLMQESATYHTVLSPKPMPPPPLFISTSCEPEEAEDQCRPNLSQQDLLDSLMPHVATAAATTGPQKVPLPFSLGKYGAETATGGDSGASFDKTLHLSSTTNGMTAAIAYVTNERGTKMRQLAQTPMHGLAMPSGNISNQNSLATRNFLARIMPETVRNSVLQRNNNNSLQSETSNKAAALSANKSRKRARKAAKQTLAGESTGSAVVADSDATAAKRRRKEEPKPVTIRRQLSEFPKKTIALLLAARTNDALLTAADNVRGVLASDLGKICQTLDRAAEKSASDAALLFHNLLFQLQHAVTHRLTALLFDCRQTYHGAKKKSAAAGLVEKRNFCAEKVGGVAHLLSMLASIVSESDDDAHTHVSLATPANCIVGANNNNNSDCRNAVPFQKRLVWAVCLLTWPQNVLQKYSCVAQLRVLSLARYSQSLFDQCYGEVLQHRSTKLLCALLSAASCDALPSIVYYSDVCADTKVLHGFEIAQHLFDSGRLSCVAQVQQTLMICERDLSADVVRVCMLEAYQADDSSEAIICVNQIVQGVMATSVDDNNSTTTAAFIQLLDLLSTATTAGDQDLRSLCADTLRSLIALQRTDDDASRQWLADLFRARGHAKTFEVLFATLRYSRFDRVDLCALHNRLLHNDNNESGGIDDAERDRHLKDSVPVALNGSNVAFVQLPVPLRRKESCGVDGANNNAVLFFDGFDAYDDKRVRLLNLRTEPAQVLSVAREDFGTVDLYEVFVRLIDNETGQIGAPRWHGLATTLECKSWDDGTFGVAWCAKMRQSLFERPEFATCWHVQDVSIESLDVGGAGRLQADLIGAAIDGEAQVDDDDHEKALLGERFVRVRHRNVLLPLGGGLSMQIGSESAHQYIDKTLLNRIVAEAFAASDGMTAEQFVADLCARNDNEFIVDAVQFEK